MTQYPSPQSQDADPVEHLMNLARNFAEASVNYAFQMGKSPVEEIDALEEAIRASLAAPQEAPAAFATAPPRYVWVQDGQVCAEPAAAASAEPVLTTCNCRWDGDECVQQCTLHNAWADTLHEYAEELRALRAASPVNAAAPEAAFWIEARTIESIKETGFLYGVEIHRTENPTEQSRAYYTKRGLVPVYTHPPAASEPVNAAAPEADWLALGMKAHAAYNASLIPSVREPDWSDLTISQHLAWMAVAEALTHPRLGREKEAK